MPTARRLVFGLACALAGIAAPGRAEEPRFEDVLSSVTLSFGRDGEHDRAILVQSYDDATADLYLFRSLSVPKAGQAAPRPAFFKNIVFAGWAWGTLPSLSVDANGALVIESENIGIGRNKWTQRLTVAVRDNVFVVGSLAYSSQDGLEPENSVACEIDFLAGSGKRNGKPVAEKFLPIKLADWAGRDLPKPCLP